MEPSRKRIMGKNNREKNHYEYNNWQLRGTTKSLSPI